MAKIWIAALLILGGCAYQEEDDLRTIPVTNNPYIVPNHGGSGLPI